MNICKRVVGLEGDKVCTSGASDLFRTHTYVSTCFILLVPVPVYQLVWIPQRRARRVVGETPRRVIQLGLKGFRAGGLCACSPALFVPAAVNIASLLFTSGQNTSIMCHWSEYKPAPTPIFPGAAAAGVSGCCCPNHCHCFSITALPDAHGSGLQSL